MLRENTLFGEVDKVQIAIDRLREYEPPEGYYLAYSGGKDSDTILALAKMAGVKFDAHYQLTTVDPPEVVQHIKRHPEVQIHRPDITMWQLIVKKHMPPTRVARYCCHSLKEQGGVGRVVMTGVRKQESYKRSKRELYERATKKKDTMFLNPIIDWLDSDVWEFIRTFQIPYCSLYDEGFRRLGCIGCPMSGSKGQEKEFARWPKYKEAYIRAFQRMVDGKDQSSFRVKWNSGQDVFDWWVGSSGRGGVSQCDDDQSVLFE